METKKIEFLNELAALLGKYDANFYSRYVKLYPTEESYNCVGLEIEGKEAMELSETLTLDAENIGIYLKKLEEQELKDVHTYQEASTSIKAIELECSVSSQEACIVFAEGKAVKGLDGGVIVNTPKGTVVANTGAYIVKNAIGEVSVMDYKTFEKKYKRV